jgi:hypothetical protein
MVEKSHYGFTIFLIIECFIYSNVQFLDPHCMFFYLKVMCRVVKKRLPHFFIFIYDLAVETLKYFTKSHFNTSYQQIKNSPYSNLGYFLEHFCCNLQNRFCLLTTTTSPSFAWKKKCLIKCLSLVISIHFLENYISG